MAIDTRPYRYQGQIAFDVPGVKIPITAGFGSGGAGKGSTPYGDWPITAYNPHTPKYDLEGFALNNIYGRMPDPLYSDGRSDVMLHLDPKGRELDKIRSLGCLSVDPKDWPALRDQIISLQKQGYSLVAHVDQSGQVTIRQADGTSATPVTSASAFADATNAARAPIKALQTTLSKAGFDPGKIDGIQGPQTTAAVKAFQQANGLKPDGIVGPQTSAVMAALGGAAKPPSPLNTFGGRLPAAAMNGIDRLVPGQVTQPPGDFTTDATGNYDPRLASLSRLSGSLAAGGGVSGARAINGAASLMGMPPLPIPRPPLPAPLQAPPAPVQAQPPQLPAQRPSAPVAPPQVPQLRLASGKSIAPGIYNQGDHSVQVADANGDGIAEVTRIRGPMSIPGVLDPLREANAPTVAGGMIRKMLPGQLAGNASGFVPAVTDNIKSAAANAASNLGNSIGGMFGGLFAPRPATWSPWAASAFAPRQPVPMPAPRPGFLLQPAPRAPLPAPMPTVAQRTAPPSNSGGYFGGKQNAVNDTLRTLGFNV